MKVEWWVSVASDTFFFDPPRRQVFYIYSERARRDESNGMSDGPRRCPGAICEQFLWYILRTAFWSYFAHQLILLYTSIDGEFYGEYSPAMQFASAVNGPFVIQLNLTWSFCFKFHSNFIYKFVSDSKVCNVESRLHLDMK